MADLFSRLPQLQNLIKRDPEGYYAEFQIQKAHFESQFEIFKLKPNKPSKEFEKLTSFLAHVAPCYSTEMSTYHKQLIELLDTHGNVLDPSIRKVIVQALTLLKNRAMMTSSELYEAFFRLLRVQDKNLRKHLEEFFVADIKSMNKISRDEKANRCLQSIIFENLENDSQIVAKRAIRTLVELYKSRVWIGSRTVNAIAQACLSKHPKICVAAINFFLGIDQAMVEEEEEEEVDTRVNLRLHSKNTRSKKRKIDKELKKRKKKKTKHEATPIFPALEIIHDPQTLAERLFVKMKKTNEKFEVRLLIMSMIARLIGVHRLILLQFYSFLQRYMNAHQQSVTHILTYLVQSTHDLVPPEELRPVIRTVADNFIHDGRSSEVIAFGINSVREVCSRAPLILEDEDMHPIINDMVEYKSSKDKGVAMAAKSFINMLRDVYPTLLHKRDRGREASTSKVKPKAYGQIDVRETVEGTELLEYENALALEQLSGSDFENDGESDGEDEVQEDQDEHFDENKEIDSDGNLVEHENNQYEEGSEEESEEGSEEGSEEDIFELENGFKVASGDTENDSNKTGRDTEKEEIVQKDLGNTVVKTENENATHTNAENEQKIAQPIPKHAALLYKRVEAQKILTEEDFERIERLKEAKEKGLIRLKGKSKRKREEMESGETKDFTQTDSTGIVHMEDLESTYIRRKRTKEERIESMKLSKLSDPKNDQKPGGKTNRESAKNKNFMMVKKSKGVQEKLKKSIREQQSQLNRHLKTLKKQTKILQKVAKRRKK